MYETIVALILAIAVEVGVPPYFALAITLEENCCLNPRAINMNQNGTVDRGVMQLNSRYFSNIDWSCPETNIRAGISHIKWLMSLPDVNTFWAVAVCYNAGYGRLSNPPLSTLAYAERVMIRYQAMDRFAYVVIHERYKEWN